MSIKERFNSFFFLDDDEQELEEGKEFEQSLPEKTKKQLVDQGKTEPMKKQTNRVQSSGQNVVAINHQQSMKKPRITIIEPRMYSEVQEVADILLSNQSVILNFRRMEKAQAKKIIDFLMGTTYAVKGDIQRIGEEIFVCTPQSVEIDGTELQELKDHNF